MLRSGARHPDADDTATPVASTSTPRVRNLKMEADDMYIKMKEYLVLEPKFQPRLCQFGESTTSVRDGAAHVLRSLKLWFDLPPEVLINSINLFDRFLTKMKVQSYHVPCITVSCMNKVIYNMQKAGLMAKKIPIEELLSVSQSACTPRDVERMEKIFVKKLDVVDCTVSSLDWLRLLRRIMLVQTENLGIELSGLSSEKELIHMLEIVSCDAACVNARTSELALVLLYEKIEPQLVTMLASNDMASERALNMCEFTRQLQMYCYMHDSSLALCQARVRHVLSRYERSEAGRDQRQRLIWRLSERTLKVLRPTDRITSFLPTIEEQHFQVDVTPTRNRTGSESSENEETSDWPRSPVLPVYCDN